MKNILVVVLVLHYVDGSMIKMLMTQNRDYKEEDPYIRLSDPLSFEEGVEDFSICFRYFIKQVDEGDIYLMKNTEFNYISTYFSWTLDRSRVQLFQKFFEEYVQQGRTGFMDQVNKKMFTFLDPPPPSHTLIKCEAKKYISGC